MKIVLEIMAAVIGIAIAAAITASSSWHRATRASIASIATLKPSSPVPALFEAATLSGVPAPVARYLRLAIPDGHPIVRAAVATQDAEFFVNGAWHPLKATQHFSVSPPGFVWDARISMAPFMSVHVRDSYSDGRGAMRASMFGVYALANEHHKPQLDSGALQRYLGELVWLPTALFPSPALTWTAQDDRSAIVTLQDRDTIASLRFEFGSDGMPATITGDRFKEHKGDYTIQPWQIRCEGLQVRDGLVIPARCEVSWITNGVPEPYWRGRISSIEYHYDVME